MSTEVRGDTFGRTGSLLRTGEGSRCSRFYKISTGNTVTVEMRSSKCGTGAQETVKQDYQHDAGEYHIHAIVLLGESPDR
jgi:hypothetical protein